MLPTIRMQHSTHRRILQEIPNRLRGTQGRAGQGFPGAFSHRAGRGLEGKVKGVKADLFLFPESMDVTAKEVRGIVQGICGNATACAEDAFKRFTVKGEFRIT